MSFETTGQTPEQTTYPAPAIQGQDGSASVPPPPYTPPTPATYAVAATPMTPAEERNWAVASHVIPLIAMVVSAGLLGFIASLVMYLAYKDRGPFVRQAAANSLNVQITTGIALAISAILMFVLVGFITYPLTLVVSFVIHVIAAVKANQGEWYSPPMTPRFVK